MTAVNGYKTKIIYWLLAVIQACGLGVIGYWVGRVDKVEARIESHEKEASGQWLSFEGRISRAESNYDEILRRLDRMEHTLDSLK